MPAGCLRSQVAPEEKSKHGHEHNKAPHAQTTDLPFLGLFKRLFKGFLKAILKVFFKVFVNVILTAFLKGVLKCFLELFCVEKERRSPYHSNHGY